MHESDQDPEAVAGHIQVKERTAHKARPESGTRNVRNSSQDDYNTSRREKQQWIKLVRLLCR